MASASDCLREQALFYKALSCEILVTEVCVGAFGKFRPTLPAFRQSSFTCPFRERS